MARKKESLQSEAELDMTPMIDCVFLLLIFFMVTTVFKNPTQLKMTLPDAWNPVKIDQVKITVEVDADGNMAINGKPTTYDQFDAYLVAEKNKTQSKSIVIRADQDAKHGDVLKLMKLAKAVNIEQISMAVVDLTQVEENKK